MSKAAALWKQAATVILVKRGARIADSHNHGVQILMLERSSKSKFMPHACVFPGGIVSRTDFSNEWAELLAAVNKSGSSPPDYGIHAVTQHEQDRPPMLRTKCPDNSISKNIAYRLCALRETFEESGVLLYEPINAAASMIDSSVVKEWRDKVNKDASEFLTMCKTLSIVPNVWCLFEWTNWLTPTHMGRRRYDTMFYIACVDHQGEAEHDKQEIVFSKWYSPEELLDRYYKEKLLLAPPQVYEVCRFLHPDLHSWNGVKEHTHSRAHGGCERWLPVRVNCADGLLSLLPGDELYPDNPDIEGTSDSLKIHDSIKQSRHKCEQLHRIEIRGPYDCRIACTIQPRFSHVPPLQWISV